MFFNPINYLSSLIIKYVVRKVNLPSLFIGIASNLFYISKNMIRSNGFMPTIYVLYSLNREIQSGGNLNNLINNHRLNPAVVSSIITTLTPNWNQCLQNAVKINSKFKWYILGIVLSTFPKFIFYILRLLLGLTLSSLGILYSDIFNAIPFLKNLSTYFLSLVEEYSNFKFIRPVSIDLPTTINQPVDINNNHLNIY